MPFEYTCSRRGHDLWVSLIWPGRLTTCPLSDTPLDLTSVERVRWVARLTFMFGLAAAVTFLVCIVMFASSAVGEMDWANGLMIGGGLGLAAMLGLGVLYFVKG